MANLTRSILNWRCQASQVISASWKCLLGIAATFALINAKVLIITALSLPNEIEVLFKRLFLVLHIDKKYENPEKWTYDLIIK